METNKSKENEGEIKKKEKKFERFKKMRRMCKKWNE